MANHTVQDYMKAIFERFESHFGYTDPLVDKRSISIDPSEFVDLQYSSVDPAIILTRDIKIGYINKPTGETYVYIVGVKDISPSADMTDYVSCRGLQIAVIKELKLQVVSSALESHFRDILYSANDDGSVDRVEYKDISAFFQPVEIFEYKGPKVDINLLAIRLLLVNPQYLYLDYQVDTLISYSALESASYKALDYETLLRSLCTSQWRYCFLDLYRCIESLFLFNRCNSLYHSLGSLPTLDETIVCDSLYDKFSLFFVEKDILDDLLKAVTPATDAMLKALPQTRGVESYYGLRNSIAHGSKRPDKHPVNITEVAEWNAVCDFSLHAIKDLFDKYDSDFFKFKYR